MKSVRHIVVVVAMMAVAAVGGVNAEQIKLLDYKTGEIFYDSEKDKYIYTYSFTLDELGFTYEFNCRYAKVRELDDGKGSVSIEPIGMRSPNYTSYLFSNPQYISELHELEKTPYRSVKHTILEADYIELKPCKLAALNPYCSGCGYHYEFTPFKGNDPDEIVTYSYWKGSSTMDIIAYCHMLQYNYEEQIVRLYTHQKIRFDYSTEEYEAPEQPTPPSKYSNAILLDCETGEMTEMDSEQPDIPEEYKCHSEVSYDNAGFTYEYDARYAMIYPIEDLLFAWPCGKAINQHKEYNGFWAASDSIKPVESITPETKKYKGLKYEIIEADYIDVTQFNSATLFDCSRCQHNPGVWPTNYIGFQPQLLIARPYHDDALHVTSFLKRPVECVAMQYNYEEKTLRLYKRLKIRFDYTKNYGFEEQSGMTEVEADGGDGEVRYFNLQGVRVTEPRAGQLYIERRGNSGRLLRL